MCACPWLVLFIEHHVFKVHPCCSMYQYFILFFLLHSFFFLLNNFLWPNNILLYGYAIFYPFIRWAFLVGHSSGGLFLPFSYSKWYCDEESCTSLCMLKHLFSVLLGISLGVELSSARVILCFNFMKNHQTVFHSCCTILHSHQQYMMVPFSLHPLLHLFSVFFFKL